MRNHLFATIALAAAAAAPAAQFVPLAQDGIHDPESPVITMLQPPQQALELLPTDSRGMTNWVAALGDGHISPRADLAGTATMKGTDLDIIMKNTSTMPNVTFSHKIHTQWLTCSNCHSRIFVPQVGGNFITMATIMSGQYCGACHGKVAFSQLQCERCHNVTAESTGLR